MLSLQTVRAHPGSKTMQKSTARSLDTDVLRECPRSASVHIAHTSRSDAVMPVHDTREVDAYGEIFHASRNVGRAPHCQPTRHDLHKYAWDPTPRAPTIYQTEALSLFGDHTAVEPEGLLSLPSVYASQEANHARPSCSHQSMHVSSAACHLDQQLEHKKPKLLLQVLNGQQLLLILLP